MRDARQRRLAGEARAGAALRGRARRTQLDYARDHWKAFAGFAGIFIVMSPVLLLFPAPVRSFATGAYAASAVWFSVLTLWQLSGVGHLQLGDLGERWTAQELHALERDGWRPIHHIVFRHWDVDHVAVGPGGVVVIETKGGRTEWSDARYQARLQAAAGQARRNADDTRRALRHIIKDAPVHSAVALWPSRNVVGIRTLDGTTLLPGRRLAEWVRELPAGSLDPDTIDTAWERLAKYAEERDAKELEEHGPSPRSLERWFADVMQYVFGVLIGFLAGAAALDLSPLLSLCAAGVMVAVAGTGGRSLPVAQRFLYTSAATGALLVAAGFLLRTLL